MVSGPQRTARKTLAMTRPIRISTVRDLKKH